MLIVQVLAHVRPEHVDAFLKATLDNARHSIQEPGIVRFDVFQQRDDPTRFTLIEIYRSADDPPKHRETAHYKAWRAGVDDLMAEPRSRVEYSNIFPDDAVLGKKG